MRALLVPALGLSVCSLWMLFPARSLFFTQEPPPAVSIREFSGIEPVRMSRVVDRLHVTPVPVVAKQAFSTPQPKPVRINEPTLTGLVRDEHGTAIAILLIGTRSHALRAGQEAGDWTVTAIADGRVTLRHQRSDEQRTLRLLKGL